MRGSFVQFVKLEGAKPVCSVAAAKAKHKEECELRLARIQNGKEPGYQNGHPKRRV